MQIQTTPVEGKTVLENLKRWLLDPPSSGSLQYPHSISIEMLPILTPAWRLLGWL